MRISIHPRLVEEAVFTALRAAEGRPAAEAASAWLRRRLERGYRLPPGSAWREIRFERVHASLFGRLGLAGALRRLCAAHPFLDAAEGGIRVGPAPGPGREGFDLHERAGPDGRPVRTILGSVLPGTAADPSLLGRRLHRSACQAADLLDPAFRWAPGEGAGEGRGAESPARRETVRLRYGAAWDAWTDGRLARRGLPAPATGEEGERAFLAVFGAVLDPGDAAAARAALAAAPALTHGDLLGFARDPGTLPGVRAARSPGAAPRPRAPFPPGGPCPLCRFPTHDWVPEPESLPGRILEGARASRPGWTPGDGMCGQCELLFRGRPQAAGAR